MDLDRIADQLVAWESFESAERPDLAALYPGDDEEAAELRRRAELLLRFDAAFGNSMLTGPYQTGAYHGAPTETGLPTVPGCAIRGVLGRGGMGIVYRAWQEDLQREVAVKVLSGPTGHGAARSRRFVQEARVLARLRHEHIVPVYEAALHLGEPFFVMELMTGGSLAGARERFAEPSAAAKLVEQVARAVQHAHAQEILHRDLKPANILLDDHSRPRVSDFGLAKLFGAQEEPAAPDESPAAFADPLGDTPAQAVQDRLTASNAIVGTPLYMAPEQLLTPHQVGPAVDVWALGVILYELLTGQRPFGSHSPGGLRHAILEMDPPKPHSVRPQLPHALGAITLKCLAKAPADRYASAAALADDLGRWLQGNAPLAYPDNPPRRLFRLVRRHSTVAVIVALVFLGAAAALTAALVAYRNDPERVRESIAEALQAGRPTILLADSGPPRSEALLVGAESTHRSADADRPYFVSTHGVALIELWRSPPPIYRFEVEVRHEDNPADGTIGLFFDHRDPGPDIAQPNCYVVSYTDRGANSRRLTLPGGQRGSRVGVNFQNFEVAAHGVFDHGHRIDEKITHVPPTPNAGPSPWRRLRIDVGTRAVAFHWSPGADLPDQQIRLDDKSFQRHARLLRLALPELQGYQGRPTTRGPLGLYVSRSAASFRNAILEPLSVEP